MKQEQLLSLAHFEHLLGEYGLYQHAQFLEPRLSEGYCVDDNARAVLVLIRLFPYLDGMNANIASRGLALCWKFLLDATRNDGTMYNFRTAEGVWLTHDISGDMYARVLRACVAVITCDTDKARIQQARELLDKIIHNIDSIYIAPRACAETLITFRDLAMHEKLSQDMQDIAQECANRLIAEWDQNASQEWPWFEHVMTYANAILPHGILAALQIISDPDKKLEHILRRSSNFLCTTTIREHMFIPIGNSSWYRKNGRPSEYDQQPIEAATMLDFLIDLRNWDQETISSEHVLLPYEWFFGNNTAQLEVANNITGTCYDGLHDGAVNENCGAESLLSYMWAEVRMRQQPTLAR
ncbi:MAG TPA: hypothetical protein VLG69_04330 [Candidatus Andersenbacteria bacterium]|nr:hypothetical protein [Candidatus Andersenbacteria bacterium]